MDEHNYHCPEKIDSTLSQKFNVLERESSDIDDIIELGAGNLKITKDDKQSDTSVTKMGFDRGNSYFSEKQEDKIHEIRKKAAACKDKLKECVDLKNSAKIFVENEINKLKHEWPVLFGMEATKIYVHVDLDAFFASVETLEHPEYKDVPMAVGSNFMVSACNYKAREYGVRSGMPGYLAKDLCPMLIITKLNFSKYNYYSELVMNILSSFDQEIEIYGIDEACLSFDNEKFKKAYIYYINTYRKCETDKPDEDINNMIPAFSFAAVNDLVLFIREAVYIDSGLTVSAGISVCRGLAKLSSKIKKPNGQFVLERNFNEYIENLNVDEINGIGKATKELLLCALNVIIIKDLKEKIYLCYLIFKSKTFLNILRLSYGLSLFDSCEKRPRGADFAKSQSVDVSIFPCTLYSDILFYLWNISGQLESGLSKHKLGGYTITIKIRYIDFEVITRRKKCLMLLIKQTEIFDMALSLVNSILIKVSKYNGYFIQKAINLVGIGVSNLIRLCDLNTIDKYLDGKCKFMERVCIICYKKFYSESYRIFELHVNKCIDESQKIFKTKASNLNCFLKNDKN